MRKMKTEIFWGDLFIILQGKFFRRLRCHKPMKVTDMWSFIFCQIMEIKSIHVFIDLEFMESP